MIPFSDKRIQSFYKFMALRKYDKDFGVLIAKCAKMGWWIKFKCNI